MKLREEKSRFCKQLLRAIFYITFEFNSDINTQDQVQTSNIDTDSNSKENQVNVANTQNKFESESRPDEGNNLLN